MYAGLMLRDTAKGTSCWFERHAIEEQNNDRSKDKS